MRNQATFLHDVHEFAGSPYEIGLQRGRMTAERVRKALQGFTTGNPYFKDLWPKPEHYDLSYFKEHYPSQYNRYIRALENTPDWFREEARGNAEGAGVPYEKMITAWFPFVFPHEGKAPSSAVSGVEGGLDDDCNGFVAYGKATADSNPLIGGNGETDHLAIRGKKIILMKNKVGNSFVMETNLPWLNGGQSGMNEKGVCLFGSGVSIKPEEWGDFGHRLLIRRLVLQEANNIDEP